MEVQTVKSLEHANPTAPSPCRSLARSGARLPWPATTLIGLLVAAGCGGAGSDLPADPDGGSGDQDGSMGPGTPDAMVPDGRPGPDAGPPEGFDFPDQITASNGAANNWFGYSVAAAGDVIVVGAPFYDRVMDGEVIDASIGTVYVFERMDGTWVQTAQLFSSDGATSAMFGWSVGVDGDLIAAGAWKQASTGTQLGAVYVFERNGATWGQSARLTPPAGDAQEAFGYAVAVSADRVAVGAPINTDIDENEPATPAYVFERSGVVWNGTPIRPGDDARDAWFGTSIALDGDTLVVGAPGHKLPRPGAGAAYVYEHDGNGWDQVAQLDDPDGQTEDFFGRSVAVHDDVIVVGAEGGDGPALPNSGVAVVYERSEGTWSETALLAPDDSVVGQQIGFSVAVRGATIVVGANRDDQFGFDAGAAYVYEQDTDGNWVQFSKIYDPDGFNGDHFGAALAVTDTFIVAGSRYDDEDGVESGSLYVFEKLAAP